MDETSFDIDHQLLAEGCRRFPERRGAARRAASRPTDLGFLRQGDHFGRHAWDEAGRP